MPTWAPWNYAREGEAALELKGDARTALARYEEAKRLHQQIERKRIDSAQTVWQIHRTIGHDDQHLGQVFLVLGQARNAQPYFKEALGYYKEWQAVEPQNLLAPSFVKEAHMRIGIAAVNLNDPGVVEEQFSMADQMGLEEMQRSPNLLRLKSTSSKWRSPTAMP